MRTYVMFSDATFSIHFYKDFIFLIQIQTFSLNVELDAVKNLFEIWTKSISIKEMLVEVQP